MPALEAVLLEATRRLHRALLEALLMSGAVPHPVALARAAGIERDELPVRGRELVAGDYAALGPDGRLIGLYPLAALPTLHVVVIDGEHRHAMCAIDALGIPAMLGRELTIEDACGLCHAPIRLLVRPGEVTAAEPPTTVVVARRDEAGPAAEFCCPATLFACGQEHGRQLVERLPGTDLLSLHAALVHGEAHFGDLLRAEMLPARRRRWGTLARPGAGAATAGDG